MYRFLCAQHLACLRDKACGRLILNRVQGMSGFFSLSPDAYLISTVSLGWCLSVARPRPHTGDAVQVTSHGDERMASTQVTFHLSAAVAKRGKGSHPAGRREAMGNRNQAHWGRAVELG